MIYDNASPDVVMMLVGNKSDLSEERMVSIEEGRQFAFDHNMDFFEVSAKDGSNIDKAFHRIVHRLHAKLN